MPAHDAPSATATIKVCFFLLKKENDHVELNLLPFMLGNHLYSLADPIGLKAETAYGIWHGAGLTNNRPEIISVAKPVD
ncbi:MAG: hypothetical protein CMM47_07435 [Rhodospirillaceae bacterium]|nr:hypothetical protein [Rhodospirillaceae bacterium]|tara:strand:+ start:226 stop:462 length:237 start_codon:yes stop_codon:yes gene_type:complete